MLNGGKFLNCSYKQNDSSTFETTVNVSCPNNITYQPTPIWVSPPFLSLITNASELNDTLNCTKNRYLSQCWNVTAFKLAVIMHIPTHVPIPVSIPEDKLPVVLSRKKRDFGITAAVVTALAISTAAATAAAVSLATTIPTAEVVNTPAEEWRLSFKQSQINAHLQAGILIVNQRVDLVQEQVDIWGALLGLGCIVPFPAICVTPIAYTNMSDLQNVSRQLSQYLRGN